MISPQDALAEMRQRIQAAQVNPVPPPPSASAVLRRHHNAQARGWTVSDIVITPDGAIRAKEDAGPGQEVSRVSTEVFAARSDDDLARDRLPANAAKHTDLTGKTGWVYTITTDFRDQFTLFLFRDHYMRLYRVQVLSPPIEQLGLGHETHIFSDGTLCISPHARGVERLADAYGRSVMWCTGISLMVRGHGWPWGCETACAS